MKTRTLEIYNCDHCNKLYLKKHAVIYHEEVCKRNPSNNRPCFRCIHLSKSYEQALVPYFNEDEVRNVKVLYCLKKEICLYTPINKIKGNWYDLIENTNEEMPKECDLFQGNDLADFTFLDTI